LKKATIVVSLCEESEDIYNCDLEEEIGKELSKNLSAIPWAVAIQSITVK
jgi:hypothetical protein